MITRSEALLLPLFLGFLWGQPANALNELFEFYTPVQAASMGNAMTADATGYLSNYYNPAGLAKTSRRKWEVTAIDFEGNYGLGGISRALSGMSFGASRLFAPMAAAPNAYTFFSMSSVPSIAMRNFCLSLFSNYRYAALDDGANLDINSVFDLGPTMAVAYSFYRGVLKLGVTGKLILRNQLSGNYAHGTIDSSNYESLSKEGLGIGADIGAMLVIPYKAFPTIGLVVKDVLGTKFTPTHLLNSAASGEAPESLPQTVNVAASVHPRLGKRFVGTFAAEIKHVTRNDLPLLKRLHFGIQLEDEKSFYMWLGMNQMKFTAGVALRLPGGNLELGTYGMDIGAGTEFEEDRRLMFRYTVGW